MNPAAIAELPGGCSHTTQSSAGPDRITRNVYDAADQLLQVQRAYGTPIQQDEATYTYSDNGRRTSVTDGNGNRAEMAYDGFDRQQRWVLPHAGPGAPNQCGSAGAANPCDYEEYGYDAAGNRLSLRKRDGSTIAYTYDNLNRLILKAVPERDGLAATHTRDVHYGYDLRNAQLYARFDTPAGEGVTNVYDGFGRPTASILLMDGVSRGLGRVYDDVNNRVTLYHPSGYAFTYAHDALGRLSSVSGGHVTSATLATFAYNSHGLPAARTETGGSGIAYSYDAAGRLTGIADTFTGGAGNATIGLAYNRAGQITSRSQSNDAYAWTGHHAVNRPYAVNGLNQYNSAGGTAFTYDANGNLLSETPPSPGPASSYTYDVENRLVAASGARTAALRYDPLGRLYEVTGTSGTTRFLYDGDALVAEYVAVGLASVYVHGSNAGADDPLVWYVSGTLRWLYSDHQGSITGLADPQGNLASINAYDEYGIPGAANYSRFQYTGQAWLAELGMYHYKARIYSPTLGRFLQTDPVGYDDQVNLYGYVGNDPVNGTDPTGTIRCSNNVRCDEVHAAAREARAAARQASADLRGIAGSMRNGTELTSEQQTTVAAYERRFGAGSATVSNLNSAARHFDRVANRIGEAGSGMRATFRDAAFMGNNIASARGSSLNIGPKFFGEDGGMGYTQPFVILHEGGHSAGLRDQIMPSHAPPEMGRWADGNWKAYGRAATDWLGAHAPNVAARNNDSYNCFVMPACGLP